MSIIVSAALAEAMNDGVSVVLCVVSNVLVYAHGQTYGSTRTIGVCLSGWPTMTGRWMPGLACSPASSGWCTNRARFTEPTSPTGRMAGSRHLLAAPQPCTTSAWRERHWMTFRQLASDVYDTNGNDISDAPGHLRARRQRNLVERRPRLPVSVDCAGVIRWTVRFHL